MAGRAVFGRSVNVVLFNAGNDSLGWSVEGLSNSVITAWRAGFLVVRISVLLADEGSLSLPRAETGAYVSADCRRFRKGGFVSSNTVPGGRITGANDSRAAAFLGIGKTSLTEEVNDFALISAMWTLAATSFCSGDLRLSTWGAFEECA